MSATCIEYLILYKLTRDCGKLPIQTETDFYMRPHNLHVYSTPTKQYGTHYSLLKITKMQNKTATIMIHKDTTMIHHENYLYNSSLTILLFQSQMVHFYQQTVPVGSEATNAITISNKTTQLSFTICLF